MLIAVFTAILMMGGNGGDWFSAQLADFKHNLKSEVQSEPQRAEMLAIVHEMQSLNKQYSKRDQSYTKELLKFVQEHDAAAEQIGGVMLQSNLNRAQFQRDIVAERFRLIEASNEAQWAQLHPGTP